MYRPIVTTDTYIITIDICIELYHISRFVYRYTRQCNDTYIVITDTYIILTDTYIIFNDTCIVLRTA